MSLRHFWVLQMSCHVDVWQWLTFVHTKGSTNPSFHPDFAGFASNHSPVCFYILERKISVEEEIPGCEGGEKLWLPLSSEEWAEHWHQLCSPSKGFTAFSHTISLFPQVPSKMRSSTAPEPLWRQAVKFSWGRRCCRIPTPCLKPWQQWLWTLMRIHL